MSVNILEWLWNSYMQGFLICILIRCIASGFTFAWHLGGIWYMCYISRGMRAYMTQKKIIALQNTHVLLLENTYFDISCIFIFLNTRQFNTRLQQRMKMSNCFDLAISSFTFCIFYHNSSCLLFFPTQCI